MKKPRQTKTAKRSSRLQRQERRNFQVGGTKKNAVHFPHVADDDNPPNPTAAPRAKPKPKSRKSRMIDLRVERMTRRMVTSLTDAPGSSYETHCNVCGLGLSTFYEWMGQGEELPKSCYGKFRTAMVRAMAQGEKVLHRAAMRTHALHLLARRFPHHYPSERQLMEISGKDGLPLIPANEQQFNVVLELNPSSPPLEDKPFVIEHVGGDKDGQCEIWTPPQPNGQEPR